MKVGNRLKSVWWRNSAIYVAHCTNMKACWGRWKNRIFQSTSIICTLYHIQYLVIVLKTREYIGEIINRSGNERREKLYFSFLVMSYLIPLIKNIIQVSCCSRPSCTLPLPLWCISGHLGCSSNQHQTSTPVSIYQYGGYSVTYSASTHMATQPASQPGREEGGAALNVWYGWTGQPTNPALSAVCATLQPTAAACRHKLDFLMTTQISWTIIQATNNLRYIAIYWIY